MLDFSFLRFLPICRKAYVSDRRPALSCVQVSKRCILGYLDDRLCLAVTALSRPWKLCANRLDFSESIMPNSVVQMPWIFASLKSSCSAIRKNRASGILVDSSDASDFPDVSDGEIVLDSCAYQVPHPKKRHKGGEDTLFMSANGRVVGVFDGVGGWADVGVDPRKYALKLSQGAQDATDKHNLLRPLDVLKHAYEYSRGIMGSSLACIATVSGKVLAYANLGDSSLLVIRPPSTLLHQAPTLQHSFNLPYQLGIESRDLPKDAVMREIDVEVGDIILLGTDGLFDNLDNESILDIFDQLCKSNPETRLDQLAIKISQAAFAKSQDRRSQTPFSKKALEHGFHFPGGKPDDITVLISRVTSCKDAKEQKSIRRRLRAAETVEKTDPPTTQFNFQKLRSLFYWKTLLT